MTVWVIAGLLALATGVRIGWALVNKQSLVSAAMIIALGSLALVAAFNWPPLTLFIDDAVGWPNVSVALSQVALIACAAGSSVMITAVAARWPQPVVRRIALAQYAIATLVAIITLVLFFRAARQPEVAPAEYLANNLDSPSVSLPWLLPLLYIALALAVVSVAGVRHSNRTRRGRALFVFTLGMLLILLATAYFVLRASGTTALLPVSSALVLLGVAMAVIGAGSLLPTIEDWFAGRRELALTEPLLTELQRRQPDLGIGVRPRGPIVYRVAERLSLISDALYLEASAALHRRPGSGAATAQRPEVSGSAQARAVAEWIRNGRGDRDGAETFPGPEWLRQPEDYSDREWIIEIARQYRDLDEAPED